ncbi:hypothetical protein [Pseudomonas sp. S2_H01]
MKQLTEHGETSKFEIENLSWAVQDTGCLESSVPTLQVRRGRMARCTNAENEKSPSRTGFLFMSSGLAGVFEVDLEKGRLPSVSRLLADLETF